MILAHNYQRPEVQDVADYVGDSLGLSRQAAAAEADDDRLLRRPLHGRDGGDPQPGEDASSSPTSSAGCSLAASIDADQLREWKAQHPGAVVVSYVNTTAEVKAESDYCCTSGQRACRDRGDPADQEILFLPDMYLGLWLETGHRPEARRSGSASATSTRESARRTSSAGRPRPPTPSCSSIPSAAARARRWRSPTSRTQDPLDRGDDRLRQALAEAALRGRDRDRHPPPAEPGGARQAVRGRARRRRSAGS